jgi:hypothetical protein
VVLVLYKALSNYGSSVPRAFVWMLFFLLVLFPVCYSVTGTRPIAAGEQAARFTASGGWEQDLGAYRNAMWLSLEVATFQKNGTLEPASAAGRHIGAIETITVPGQLALFLLAVRRRFKR